MDTHTFELQVLRRVPFAEAAMTILDQIFQPDDLAKIYRDDCGRTYQRILTFSSEMLWREVRDDLKAGFRLIAVSVWPKLLEGDRSIASARARVSELLRGCWKKVWLKSRSSLPDPSRPAPPKPVRKKQSKGHESVQRILERKNVGR